MNKIAARPRIKIGLTTADMVVELTGWFALLVFWGFTILSYPNLPGTIPVHYNEHGVADGFGDKVKILILPVVATIFFIGITILNKFPHLFNYPTDITEQNAFRQYTNMTRMNRYLKLVFVILFGLIAFKTIKGAGEGAAGLGAWFLPLTVAMIFIPLVYFVVNSLRMK